MVNDDDNENDLWVNIILTQKNIFMSNKTNAHL